MFHLQTRVGLHEHEAVFRPAVDQELDGADASVGRGRRNSCGSGEHRFPHGRWEAERGRDLDELLALPLQAALAVHEVDDVPGAVADDLHLDVTCAGEEFLDVEFRRAEGLFGF